MSKFKLTNTQIEGLVIIEPKVYIDERGYFMESYNKDELEKLGLKFNFVQDNQSSSIKGVLRGLHKQKEHEQGKLVRVLRGEVFDVAVDARKDSCTYGKWAGIVLTEKNKKMLYIPKGFLHGFLVLSDIAEFFYKCTDFYYPNDQEGVLYNDLTLNINWPLDKVDEVILSEKDKRLNSFKSL